jgi:hypothetical protein
MMIFTCKDSPKECVSCRNMIKIGERHAWRRRRGMRQQYLCLTCAPAREEQDEELAESDVPPDGTEPEFEEMPDPPPGADGSVQAALATLAAALAPKAPALDESRVAEIARAIAIEEGAGLRADVTESVGDVLDSAFIRERARIIKAATDAARAEMTLRIEVTAPSGAVAKIDGAHECFPELLKRAQIRDHNGFRIPLYLHGPAGSGKSRAGQQVSDALFPDVPQDERYRYFSLCPVSPESKAIGFRDATGTIHDSPFTWGYPRPCVIVIDEADFSSALVITQFNDALSNGHGSFPAGLVARHPDVVVIATGNTIGLGATKAYPERRPLDRAFRDRFAFMAWPIDPKLERRTCIARNPKAEPWVAWIQATRAWAASNIPDLEVSSRAAFGGSAYLAAGVSAAASAETFVFRGVDCAERVLRACPLPTADMAVCS